MKQLHNKCPRVVLSGLNGGSGKTVATLGLTEIWRRKGLVVAPFKKGPDYIDVAWHAFSAGRASHNLDTFLMEPDDILWSLENYSRSADVALVEGNRGLYDGMDASGTHSTAELAKLIDAPVVLVVNCTKATRTVAALVLGCKMMDADVRIGGVILNQVANIRQESIIRTAIEKEVGIPVMGSIPRMGGFSLSERHLGLVPPQEHPRARRTLDDLFSQVLRNIDADAVFELAVSSAPLPLRTFDRCTVSGASRGGPRIGVFRDSAFTFYYPENLEALERCGAKLVEISALCAAELPPLDALYIGGGFPETHARELAENEGLRASVLKDAVDGLPIYAECGGLIFLAEAVEFGGNTYPMAGVFPVTFSVREKPQGHGYMVVEADKPNPFFPKGTVLRGHEFHYAGVSQYKHDAVETVFKVRRGAGFDCGRDGLVYRNVLASFCHVHALGEKRWANALVELASQRAEYCSKIAS
ncbi:MAG: hydrogenobyrinic acid a,c-diamide synthase (glutamine-hydrolyzing) [Candidatus Abyssubacteria bacterium]